MRRAVDELDDVAVERDRIRLVIRAGKGVMTVRGHGAREEDQQNAGTKALHGGRIIGILRVAAATTLLLALLLAALPLAQSPTPIGVVSAAGRRTLSTSVVNDQEYVA